MLCGTQMNTEVPPACRVALASGPGSLTINGPSIGDKLLQTLIQSVLSNFFYELFITLRPVWRAGPLHAGRVLVAARLAHERQVLEQAAGRGSGYGKDWNAAFWQSGEGSLTGLYLEIKGCRRTHTSY